MVQGNQSDSDGNYNATSTFGGVAKQYADRIGDTAEKGAKAIVQKVQETGNAASDKAQKFGASVENQADSALSSVGDTVSSFAGTIRDNSPAKETTIGSAVIAVADGLQASGEYLSHNGMGDIAKDMTAVIRRNPIHSLWIGMGVGVLVGAALSRK
jgi:ElaB/YqjD/DUF883 family membrane-anchored ribosome-binding protein